MDQQQIKELMSRIAELENHRTDTTRQHESLRMQLNATNSMLIQIKEGILGNDFNTGMKSELSEMKRLVSDLPTLKKDVDEVKQKVSNLEKFEKKMNIDIAKGIGAFAALSIIVNVIWNFIKQKFF